MTTTRFTDPAAVDAWDQWFRWRHAEGLRDRTIDATWERVARAVAATMGEHASLRRYIEAFSRWQLLPDERLLRTAGTARAAGPLESPTATLNVAAFVTAPPTRPAHWDAEGFSGVAALAVRLLDDALLATRESPSGPRDLRIGVFGFADALDLLGIGYADAEAVQLASRVGAALAHGTLRGTVDLAHERGAIRQDPARWIPLWRARGTPAPLIADALHWGVRHARLSAIERQPRLALLANNASDALDPAPPSRHRRAETRATRGDPTHRAHAPAADCITAQRALRAAMQPSIDAPIDYPVVNPSGPPWPMANPLRADAIAVCAPNSGSN